MGERAPGSLTAAKEQKRQTKDRGLFIFPKLPVNKELFFQVGAVTPQAWENVDQKVKGREGSFSFEIQYEV